MALDQKTRDEVNNIRLAAYLVGVVCVTMGAIGLAGFYGGLGIFGFLVCMAALFEKADD